MYAAIILSILSGVPGIDYEPGALVITVAPEFRSAVKVEKAYYDGAVRTVPVDLSGIPGVAALNAKYGLTRSERLIHMPLSPEAYDYNLDLIFYLHFDNMPDAEKAAAEFAALPAIADAAPNLYVPILDTVPNDPSYGSQWHLPKIHAPQGWEFARGDSVVFEGVDTGVDWDHEDIYPSLWVNPGEDIDGSGDFTPSDLNGVDDDGNGYVDDVIGFDFSDGDWDPTPNPTLNGSYHGTHVYGIMVAATNNGIGVASPGWEAKGIATKCDAASGGEARINIAAAVNAIYYAADMGANVTNHSYGSYSQYSPARTALQYAHDSKKVMNFAAAGNDNVSNILYPAGYGYFVFAVAATDDKDTKSSYSNYGSWIDVSAPGDAIYSTLPDDSYGSLFGTSMASPCAAGVGGVVYSKYRSLSINQIDSLVLKGCVDIDSLNPGYEGRLGWGRVDLFKSLTINEFSHVMLVQDSFDVHPDTNNTVRMFLTLTNELYYQDASNITATITTSDPNVNITDNQIQISLLQNGDTTTPTDYFEMSFSGDIRFVDAEIHVNATPASIDSVFPIRFLVGFPDVVLVDAAEGSVDTFYTNALDSLGIMYELVDTQHIDALQNAPRKTVIWFTGLNQDPVSPSQIDSIIAYMDQGGCFVMTSQYLAEDQDAPPLLYKLGAGITDTDVNVGTAKSVDPDITNGVHYRLTGGAGNLASPDDIYPLSDADTAFIYTAPNGTGYYGVGGVKKNTQFYHSLYLAFPIEGILDGGSGGGTQKELLNAIINWCENVHEVAEKPGAPGMLSLSVKPNVFSDKLSVVLSVPAKQDVSVVLYDAAGKRVEVLHSGTTEPGSYVVNLNPKRLRAGVYFITLNGQLAHKIIRVN